MKHFASIQTYGFPTPADTKPQEMLIMRICIYLSFLPYTYRPELGKPEVMQSAEPLSWAAKKPLPLESRLPAADLSKLLYTYMCVVLSSGGYLRIPVTWQSFFALYELGMLEIHTNTYTYICLCQLSGLGAPGYRCL